MEIIGIHKYFSSCLQDSRTKDHIRGPMAREHGHLFSNYKKTFQFGTCHFKITARNTKAIFRENLSSRCFDSGKIYKIIIFTRGPRTTYCTTFLLGQVCIQNL